jgi:hypothetical protein
LSIFLPLSIFFLSLSIFLPAGSTAAATSESREVLPVDADYESTNLFLIVLNVAALEVG